MKEIIQYLQNIAELESQKYTQNQLMNQIYGQAQRLGHPKQFEKMEAYDPNQKDAVEIFSDCVWSVLLSMIIAFVISVVIAIFCWISDGFGSFQKESGVLWGWFMAISIPLSIFFIWVNVSGNGDEKEKYQYQYEQYQREIAEDIWRVTKENERKKALMAQIESVRIEKERTQKTLNSLYEIGVIHPKYRNFVAITAFYDYFDTGCCFSLTGPGGAYARFEEELRFQRIETKLDVIISKLDEIIANQQYIGCLIREANMTLRQINQQNNVLINKMDSIEKNTKLIEYNTQCSARCNIVMSHLMVYQALKKEW